MALTRSFLCRSSGKDPEVRYIPNGGRSGKPAGGRIRSWRDEADGGGRSRAKSASRGAVQREVAGEYLAQGAQVYIEGQLRTRSWEDNGITRYVTEILVKTTGTMQMLGRCRRYQTQPEEAQLVRPVSLMESQPEPKKGGAKTKGRGRKAAQPELSSRLNPRMTSMTTFRSNERQ
uniref:single-stranded DNA-binding protein n=1 Tax=Escherichia coli TaxID=562 RepID=UPI003D81571F